MIRSSKQLPPIMLFLTLIVFQSFFVLSFAQDTSETTDRTVQTQEKKNPNISIAYLVPKDLYSSNYPGALESLLKSINQKTTLRINIAPVIINSLEDEQLFNCPFLYFNLGDSQQWNWNAIEIENLKKYIERGGFIYIDAGIQASFLDGGLQQNHSFAEWRPSAKLTALFELVYPGKAFSPLPKSHEIFKAYKTGLPDTTKLPVTVKEYVEKEKWPGGTYSIVGLTIKGRLSVIATPIVAMGWGKTQDGRWAGNIMMRVKENADQMQDTLSTADYDGAKFPVTNEDRTEDLVYVQGDKPAWVKESKESSGKWRLFKYYGGNEINDFAHNYFTQLGTNILFYSLTH
jgi:hypothetical protein